MKLFAIVLLGIGVVSSLSAAVPEIDANSGASALALLAGAAVVMRSRFRR